MIETKSCVFLLFLQDPEKLKVKNEYFNYN